MRHLGESRNSLLSRVLIISVICAMYAINEQKQIMYPVKIVFILLMTLRFLAFGRFSKYTLWSVAFIMICGASVLWATDQDVALYHSIWVLHTLLIPVLIEPFIDDRSDLDFVIGCFVVGGILLAIRLLVQTPLSIWGTRRIGTAIGYNPNDVGLKLAFAALCAAYFVRKGDRRLFYLLVMILLSSLAMLSGSRKAFLIVIAGPVIFFTVSAKKANRVGLSAIMAIIFVAGLCYLVMNIEPFYNVLGYRIEIMLSTFQGDMSASFSTFTRMEMMNKAIDLFSGKPILGYGIGNFAVNSEFGTYSHNNYTELLADVGLIGFLSYYSLYVYLMKQLIVGLIGGNKTLAFPTTILLLAVILETGLVGYCTSYYQILLMISFTFLRIRQKEGATQRRKLLIVKGAS